MRYPMKLPVRFPCLLLSVLVCVGGVMLHTYNATPEWQAEAKLRVYRSAYTTVSSELIFGRDDILSITSNEDFLPQVEKMTSPAIMDAVAQRLSQEQKRQVLEPYQGGNVFSGPLGEREVIAKCYAVKPMRQTLVVHVFYTHPDKEIACFMARLFVEEIIRFNSEEWLRRVGPMIAMMGVQLKAKNAAIDAIYKRRTALIAEKGVLTLPTQIRATENELTGLAAQMDDARRHLAGVEARRRQMENPDGSDTPTENGTVPTDIGHEYESAKGKFTAAEARFKEREKQLEAMNADLNEWESINKEIMTQERSRDALQQTYEGERSKSRVAEGPRISVMEDAAITTDRPINKNYLERGLIGAAAGLALGVVLELLARVFRRNAMKSGGR